MSCPGPRTRRDVLRAGVVGSLTLPRLLAAPPAGATADACILLFMWGGPSHLDTWDPKPDAPADIRGPFASVPTTVPGLRVSEHFPRLSKLAHQYAVVRSMSHTDPAHLSNVHHLMTGRVAPRPNSDADPATRSDAPHLGSVIGKHRPAGGPVPAAVTLPWAVSHPAAPGGVAPGQHAGWMGVAADPFLVTADPNAPNFAVSGLAGGPRFAARRELLAKLDAGRDGYAGVRGQAADLLASGAAAAAFDLSREPAAVRDEYGRHTHGQSVLLARRLVEAGTRLVTVNWPDDGKAFWDSHRDNFNRHKDHLMPPADQAFAALLTDLARRGLLERTLVVWVGEFGRTPRIGAGAMREHWPQCYSAVLAGGGVRGGAVYGSSDRYAEYPRDRPVSPADLTATMYQALGVDPHQTVTDAFGRPAALTEGEPLRPLFG